MSSTHRQGNWVIRYRIALLFTLHLLASVSRAESTATLPIQVLPETDSPNGRYALGWSMHGVSAADWAKLRPPEGLTADVERFEKLLHGSYENIEDYVVLKKTGRPLALLKGIHYWNLAGYTASHRELIVAWSKNSERLLVIDNGKFSWVEIAFVELVEGRAASARPVGETIKQITLTALSRQFRDDQKFLRDKKRLVCYADRAEFLTADRLMIQIQVFHPKTDSDEDSFSYSGKLMLKLWRPDNGPLKLEFESLL